LAICSLFVIAKAQNFTCLNYEACGTCQAASSCGYCAGANSTSFAAYYVCIDPATCTANGGTVVSSCASTNPNNLTQTASIVCFSNGVNGTAYAAEDIRFYVSPNRADINVHATQTFGFGQPGSQAALVFQYFAFHALGDPAVNNSFYPDMIDGLAAFWTMGAAIEYDPITNQSLQVYNFTNFQVQPCSSIGNIYILDFIDPLGWRVTCRMSSSATTYNGFPISPVSAKCDLTFGNFSYIKNNTYLVLATGFGIAGFEETVSVVPTPTVHPCSSDPNSYCFVTTSSSVAAKFSYAKKLSSGKDVFAFGVAECAAASGSAVVPLPTSYSVGNGTSLVINKSGFECLSYTLFAFDHPLLGEVWDPQLTIDSASVLDPKTTSSKTASSRHLPSSAAFVTYSLVLIIAAALLAILHY